MAMRGAVARQVRVSGPLVQPNYVVVCGALVVTHHHLARATPQLHSQSPSRLHLCILFSFSSTSITLALYCALSSLTNSASTQYTTMRLSTSALVLGAASSALAAQNQKVLGNPSHNKPLGVDVHKIADKISELDFDAWSKPLKEAFGEASSEAKAVWDEVTMLAPDAVDAFKKQVFGPKPKKSSRIPDNKWDHVVHGADVQSVWVKNDKGESHRKVGGKLENFSLRAKKVDPSKLGVDKVKQYSGYLDDNENDKHLFYCKCDTPLVGSTTGCNDARPKWSILRK